MSWFLEKVEMFAVLHLLRLAILPETQKTSRVRNAYIYYNYTSAVITKGINKTMNPAIEKLEKEIDRYKFGIRNDEAAYILCGKYTLSLKSLKACVEALEKVSSPEPSDRGPYHPCCGGFVRDSHTIDCPVQNALTLVNRAMGVSHE